MGDQPLCSDKLTDPCHGNISLFKASSLLYLGKAVGLLQMCCSVDLLDCLIKALKETIRCDQLIQIDGI